MPQKSLWHINNALVEFVAYQNKLNIYEDLNVTTWRISVLGIERVFRDAWEFHINLFKDLVFDNNTDGIPNLLDNMIRLVQNNGGTGRNYRKLSIFDIKKLYSSPSFSRDRPR